MTQSILQLAATLMTAVAAAFAVLLIAILLDRD